MAFMSRHRRTTAPRSWWQVIIPVFTLGALLVMGIVAVVIVFSHKAQTAPEARPAPGVTQVVTPPPVKPVARPSPAQTYRVRSGDSWWKIATQFCHDGGSMTQLAVRNHASLYEALSLGRTIIIVCK